MDLIQILSFVGNVMVGLGMVAVAFAVWAVSTVLRINRKIKGDLGALEQQVDSGHLIPLVVETVNDQFFCYNANTQDFVCQGRDILEIKQRFRQRFPNKHAAICSGDESALDKLKEQVKDLHENNDSIRSTS